MFIVMHCGGMPFTGKTFPDQSLGGSETAAYYLARELARRGHRVTLFTNHPQEVEAGGVAYRYAGAVTEQTPLGERYQIYATCTPHDLNITQRNPSAFMLPTAAKLNAWWLHDAPQPEQRAAITGNMLRTDMVFAVSEWHRQQIVKAWGLDPARVYAIGNGVDAGLFDVDTGGIEVPQQFIRSVFLDVVTARPDAYSLLYTSRPERGLESLVAPGGIMERLADKLPRAHLYVCGYDNTTAAMRDYYGWLAERCNALPNVTHIGHLTKQELAVLMRSCDLLTYPTRFNETSCITAMEAQAAGLPMLSSNCGALPETCEGGGAVLLPLVPDPDPRPFAVEAGDPHNGVDLAGFTDAIVQLARLPDAEREQMEAAQLNAAEAHTWAGVADRALSAVYGRFEHSPAAIARGLMRDSDIYALRWWLQGHGEHDAGILAETRAELAECYGFMQSDDWSEHYREYYAYEKERGVNYGPENLDNSPRFSYVADCVGRLPAGAVVLDYGCAHGHYTVNLAKRFPGLRFVGVDIERSNIDKARAWAAADGVENVEFHVGQIVDGAIRIYEETGGSAEPEHKGLPLGVVEDWAQGPYYDAIIAAEVLEHVADPGAYVDTLAQYLKPDGRFIVTTPCGPWEAQGYAQHWPWRAHVHHLERQDLHDLWGHNPGFAITCISAGRAAGGEPIGSYVTQFGKPEQPSGSLDYARKLALQAPRQTLTVCMIVRDAEATIRRCIASVAAVADEFVIALDRDTTDRTKRAVYDALADFAAHKPASVFKAPSPREIGFDAARNATLERASGDWILWIDADEVMYGARNLLPYLRANQFNAYSVPHHHFSLQPAGLLKTDYPARIFRNGNGIRFFGVVHEHPETALNAGIPFTAVISDVAVAHWGYTDEDTRVERFNRNLPLMLRDRETNPDRLLGKFLWLRDLFQQTRYDLEAGSGITPAMVERAREAMVLWREIVDSKHTRLAVESLEWYSGMVEILGGGKTMDIQINGNQARATFRTKADAEALTALLMAEAG